MGKNGGSKPTETILTLEEALMLFKRKREEAGEHRIETVSEGNVHYVDFSATVEHETERTVTGYLEAADESASVSAQRDEASAEFSADGDFVAVIDGIPRTLEDLERIAAAEKAYAQDFPETTLETAEVEDDDDLEANGMALVPYEAIRNRHGLRRDYAFTAMGTALMVLVAVLMMHVPIVTEHPALMTAQSIATPALKASSQMAKADDLISTMVIVPDANVQQASASVSVSASASTSTRPAALKTGELETKIKDTLKLRAFPDIGVSVSKKGDAYLAGEVYSLDEAKKISHIVHTVNGVNRVHFLHPDVRPADGPAFFGVATASAPAVWGAKVKSVIIGSPADKAGIKAGDVISEFDGKTIPDGKALTNLVAQYSPGQRVQFRVWRNGQAEYLMARMGELQTVASR